MGRRKRRERKQSGVKRIEKKILACWFVYTLRGSVVAEVLYDICACSFVCVVPCILVREHVFVHICCSIHVGMRYWSKHGYW